MRQFALKALDGTTAKPFMALGRFLEAISFSDEEIEQISQLQPGGSVKIWDDTIIVECK